MAKEKPDPNVAYNERIFIMMRRTAVQSVDERQNPGGLTRMGFMEGLDVNNPRRRQRIA